MASRCLPVRIPRSTRGTWAILGANSSGKTTLLHTLSVPRAPSEGQVLLDGSDIRSLPPRAVALRRDVLLLESEPGVVAGVMQIVLTRRHPHRPPSGWEGSVDHRMAATALAAMDLEEFARRPL
ncbi:MAG: ATP-binding cassette domain-containing protein [Acidiferrobacterales bacterium]